MSHGLQFQAAYTWSHALDDSVDPLTPGRRSAHVSAQLPRSVTKLRQFRQRHPPCRGNQLYLGIAFWPWQKLPEPWRTGQDYGGLRARRHLYRPDRTSFPGSRNLGHAENWDRGLGLPGWGSLWLGRRLRPHPAAGSGYAYITNECAFTNPPFGSASNNERNQWYGPGFWDWDVTLAKRMSITERVKAELRFEGYNILNHPHFLNPGTDAAGIGNLIGQSEFGVITEHLYRSRTGPLQRARFRWR